MIWKRNGVTREVLLTGRYVIKLPKLTGGWSPVVFSSPGGWILVMRRAEPLTEEGWKADHP